MPESVKSIVQRLAETIAHLDTATFDSDGQPCHCDASVGAVPCEICGERELLKAAKAEIERLRTLYDRRGKRIEELAAIADRPLHDDLNVLLARCENQEPLSLADQRELFAWLEEKDLIIADMDERLVPYTVFEELAPPDVPVADFAQTCFEAWEKAAEQKPDGVPSARDFFETTYPAMDGPGWITRDAERDIIKTFLRRWEASRDTVTATQPAPTG